jgi:hypothetical protein
MIVCNDLFVFVPSIFLGETLATFHAWARTWTAGNNKNN